MFGSYEMLLLVGALLVLVFSGVHIAISLGAALESRIAFLILQADFQPLLARQIRQICLVDQ